MKLYVKTYGCQMNQLDSARIVQLMKSADYEPTDRVDDADLIILNTCSVRDKAEQKVYSALGRWRKLKEEKGVILGVGGCVAQQEGEDAAPAGAASGPGVRHPQHAQAAADGRGGP